MNKAMIPTYAAIADKWKAQRGIGSVYAINPIDCYELSIYIAKLMLNKNPTCKIFILCADYDHMSKMSVVLKQEDIKATVITSKYVKPQYKYNYDVCITIGFSVILNTISSVIEQSKFKLILLSKVVLETSVLNGLNAKYPIIKETMTAKQAEAVRASSPVEEWRIGLDLCESDQELYDKQTNYITQTLNIFGSFDDINRARVGDKLLNISATSVREAIARNNGWSPELDTTIHFNKDIDDYYNPNALFERANTAYNIMRDRQVLLTDNEDKFKTILNIVREHEYKRIIIVSKRGEYARKVTKYLENNGVHVGDYHDSIEPIQAVDGKTGIPILIKSGVHKGEPKIIKAKAISTANAKAYNAYCDEFDDTKHNPLNDSFDTARLSYFLDSGGINVLSIKNSSSPDLVGTADVVIFTSPLCDQWKEFKYRFNKLKIGLEPLLLYKVYMTGTIEEAALNKTKETAFYTIHEKEKVVSFDEKSGNIVL